MKKLLFATCCIAFLGGSLGAAAQKKSAAKNVLTQTLKGKSWSADNGNGTFTNPLFYDEFSDPDIIRVGEDYYLAGTTMHSVPGLVVLHSKDLVNWEFSSYCFDRFDDSDDFNLRHGKEAYGQGIWRLPSDIITASSISSPISTGMDCRCISRTVPRVLGRITKLMAISTTSLCSSMMMQDLCRAQVWQRDRYGVEARFEWSGRGQQQGGDSGRLCDGGGTSCV